MSAVINGSGRVYHSLLNYWIPMYSGIGKALIFSCIYTNEPSKLGWIVSKIAITPRVLVKLNGPQKETK